MTINRTITITVIGDTTAAIKPAVGGVNDDGSSVVDDGSVVKVETDVGSGKVVVGDDRGQLNVPVIIVIKVIKHHRSSTVTVLSLN